MEKNKRRMEVVGVKESFRSLVNKMLKWAVHVKRIGEGTNVTTSQQRHMGKYGL